MKKIFMHGRARKILYFSLTILSIIWMLINLGIQVLEYFLVVEKPLQHADALVVMAGERPIRLSATVKLYREGKAPRILLTNDGIFSSWSEEKQRNLYEVEWAEEDLLKMGVPSNVVVKLPHTSSGSIYDALNTRKYVLDNGLRSLLIVTSDYHTRRSLSTFERVFREYAVNIGIIPVKSETKSMPYYKRFMLLSYEMLKLVYYEFR